MCQDLASIIYCVFFDLELIIACNRESEEVLIQTNAELQYIAKEVKKIHAVWWYTRYIVSSDYTKLYTSLTNNWNSTQPVAALHSQYSQNPRPGRMNSFSD